MSQGFHSPRQQTRAEVLRAAKLLAKSMGAHLEIDVAPERLAKYIQQHWNIASPLAHVIHNGTGL